VVLGYNDNPVIPGKGSAIFLHVAKPGYSLTEGCIALSLEDLLYVLKTAGPKTQLAVNSE
jgi:L,D-peptidoglycan transpeptidase YkuD (ErfK/YbiS/YcfS/YnhG family)